MGRRPAGDQHRLGVVADHAGHEVDVRRHVGQLGGLPGGLGRGGWDSQHRADDE